MKGTRENTADKTGEETEEAPKGQQNSVSRSREFHTKLENETESEGQTQ